MSGLRFDIDKIVQAARSAVLDEVSNSAGILASHEDVERGERWLRMVFGAINEANAQNDEYHNRQRGPNPR